jgi:ribonuclease P protein component
MSLKFRRQVRIRRRPEFTAIQNTGHRVSTRSLTVLAKPGEARHDRLGIVASRKVGNAVVRNRVKRRLRELFRQQQPVTLPPGGSGLDVVVIARREAASVPFAVLRADFERALGRLRQGKA